MSRPRCCSRPRGRTVMGWLLPATILTALPKCPLCIAAYLAIATGFQVSISTAAYIRIAAIILCAACIGFLAIRRFATS